MLKIPVRTQHDKLVPDAESGKESISRADLEPAAATVVAKVCRGDVIIALWHDQRQRTESIEDLLSRFGATKSLQNLLENQPRGEDRSFVLKSVCQEVHAGMAVTLITAQCKRPDTGINEELQFRDRAAL
ncbi:MAG TPA: hypothetical protein VEZ11_02250 [Thermoanaerobaculia bacterium]|nr:hypothetical protein [Thermoanaerobaculia bacterium]